MSHPMIIRFMAFSLAVFVSLTMFPLTSPVQAASPGKVTGGQNHNRPDWFKESFLDLKEDANEAAEAGKHTMVFFDLAGCPYCARMMAESVEPQRALIEPFFDSIGLDVKGSRMVSLDGKNEMEERKLASKLRVRFTPTIIFLDKDAKTVFRINGFWNPTQFRIALNFVKTKSYKTMNISAFAKLQKAKKVYALQEHELLTKVTDFSKVKTPLLVLFEDKTCSACPELHSTVLNRKDVKKVLKTYTFVRLNPNDTSAITDTDGNVTTPAKWAEKLAITTSPTFIAFDGGNEIQRVGATLYSYHFSRLLEYVSGQHYKKFDSWVAYMGKRTGEILESGNNVNLGRDAPVLSQ